MGQCEQAVLGGERLIQTRMYGSASELWEGFSKNATEAFGGPLRTLAVAAGALAMGPAAVVLPAWAGARASPGITSDRT